MKTRLKNILTLTKDSYIITVLIIFAILFRLYTIKDNNLVFFFDQARDAFISRQILENHDLKVIGPSASGTEDQFYHGVLYYYIVGPIYSLAGGNPYTVSIIVSIINSLVIIPLYYLAYSLTKKRSIAIISSLFFAFSAQSALIGTWLSNPSLALLTITGFYLFFWKTFFEKKYNYLPLVALFLGLTNQAILFSVYMFFTLGFGMYYAWTQKELKKIPTKIYIVSVLVYLASVASMIAAELMLFKQGIVSPNKLGQIATVQEDPFYSLLNILSNYTKTVAWNILPTFLTISALIGCAALVMWYKKSDQKLKLFTSIWLCSPIILFLFQSRTNAHMLVGVAPLLYIALAYTLTQIRQNTKAIIIAFSMLFVLTNLSQINRTLEQKIHPFSVQQGAYLNDQLALIDYAYTKANHKEFSISTYTNPFGYNTTWSYLFNWYGKEKYGYVPKFYGPDQAGIFAGDLLISTQKALPIHFTIYEPRQGLNEVLEVRFKDEQNINIASPSASVNFGALTLEERYRIDM